MEKDMIVYRSLRAGRSVRIMTAVFLLLMFLVINIASCFLFSTVSFARESKKYDLWMRTIVGCKQSIETGSIQPIDEEDIAHLYSLLGVLAVFPEDHTSIALPVCMPVENDTNITIDAYFVAAADSFLPYGSEFNGYDYTDYALNGIIVPELLYDINGKAVRTRSFLGKTVRVRVDQLDYYANVPPDEAPPLLNTEYVDFTVMGFYDTSQNYGVANRIFMTPDNIGILSDLYWRGYWDYSNCRFVSVIVDSYDAVEGVITAAEDLGFELERKTKLESGAVNLICAFCSAVVTAAVIIMSFGISALQSNNLAKNGDEVLILAATGYSREQIAGYYLKPLLIETFILYLSSLAAFMPFRKALSEFVFDDAVSYRVPVILTACLCFISLGVVWLTARHKLIQLVSGPVIVSGEES